VAIATRTEIDGVPVFWRDDGEDLAMVSLSFRVGSADETLQTHGLTHLVEHLALDMGRRRYVFNGMVDATRTLFAAHGTPEQLAEFLSTVTTRLASLDLEALDRHARILRTEENSRSTGWGALAADARFGARGYGLIRYPEFALRWIGPQDVQDWVSSRFSAHNAVAWMTCPPPQGLRLSLPAGERHPAPEPRPLRGGHPIVEHWQNPLVALTAITDHSRPARAGFQVLEHDLEDELRHELGLSYSISHGNEYLGPDHQLLLVAADCLPEAAEKVRDSMLRSLERLGRDGPTDDELTRLRHDVEDHVLRMSTQPAWLDLIAVGELNGFPVEDPDSLIGVYRDMGAEEIAQATTDVLRTGILFLPMGVRPPKLWRVRETGSRRSIDGMTFRPIKGRGSQLIIGEDGISEASRDGTTRTVLWRRCVGILWGEGGRIVVNDDGFGLAVESARWKRGEEALVRIDRAVPPDRLIPFDGTAPGPRVPPALAS